MEITRPLPREEYREHLDELGGQCAFCATPAALNIREYPNWIFAYAAFPYRKYHTLLISKRHVVHFSELSPEELVELAKIIQDIEELYKASGVIGAQSDLGNQMYYSWRSRYKLDAEKKSVFHFHLHIYPEFSTNHDVVLEDDAWDIDMNRLKA
ncbi:MAG: HIT domain-containing protein [Minisyncoccia bacterium]